MQRDIDEMAEPGTPTTIGRPARIPQVRDHSLALTAEQCEATKDVPDGEVWAPTPGGTSA